MRRLAAGRKRVVAVGLVGVVAIVAVAIVLATRSPEPQARYTIENILFGAQQSTLEIAWLLVPDPGPRSSSWRWTEVTSHWEDWGEPVTIEHRIPTDGEIPAEVVTLVEERYQMPISEFGVQRIQRNRIVFIWFGQLPVGEMGVERRVLVVDVRYITGGGLIRKRWEVWESTPLYYVPDGAVG